MAHLVGWWSILGPFRRRSHSSSGREQSITLSGHGACRLIIANQVSTGWSWQWVRMSMVDLNFCWWRPDENHHIKAHHKTSIYTKHAEPLFWACHTKHYWCHVRAAGFSKAWHPSRLMLCRVQQQAIELIHQLVRLIITPYDIRLSKQPLLNLLLLLINPYNQWFSSVSF